MNKIVKNRGLGRGLDALLGSQAVSTEREQSSKIALSKIQPNRYQPRSSFDPEELHALTESIRKEGVLMPILVRPNGEKYELIAGERRWRASQVAGLTEIPAVVRDVSDLQALELAIIENEQRDDLTAIESARAYRRLVDEFSYTQKQVAESIGISRMQVSNLMRLLLLSDVIQSMIEKHELNMGQARPLVGLENIQAEKLALECVKNGWSARQMEKEVKRLLSASESKPLENKAADITALQEELTQNLGLPVTLNCKKNGSGEMKISYDDAQQLDVILKRLRTRKSS